MTTVSINTNAPSTHQPVLTRAFINTFALPLISRFYIDPDLSKMMPTDTMAASSIALYQMQANASVAGALFAKILYNLVKSIVGGSTSAYEFLYHDGCSIIFRSKNAEI